MNGNTQSYERKLFSFDGYPCKKYSGKKFSVYMFNVSTISVKTGISLTEKFCLFFSMVLSELDSCIASRFLSGPLKFLVCWRTHYFFTAPKKSKV